MMMVIPAMCKPERAMRSSLWAMVVTGALYILIVVATVGVFGAEETKSCCGRHWSLPKQLHCLPMCWNAWMQSF